MLSKQVGCFLLKLTENAFQGQTPPPPVRLWFPGNVPIHAHCKHEVVILSLPINAVFCISHARVSCSYARADLPPGASAGSMDSEERSLPKLLHR